MDNSWDNGGFPTLKGSWKYGEHLFTVSVVGVSFLVVCTVAVLWFSHNQANILQVERERAKPDWAAATLVVEAMQTEAGTKALYQANPRLSDRFRSENEFLEFVAKCRPNFDPLPKELPLPTEQNFGHRHGFGVGPTILSYKMSRGYWVTFHWSGPYNSPSRHLVDFECYQ